MFHLPRKSEFSARNDGTFLLIQKLEFGVRHYIWVYNVPFVSWESKTDTSGALVDVDADVDADVDNGGSRVGLHCKLKVVQVPSTFQHEKSEFRSLIECTMMSHLT